MRKERDLIMELKNSTVLPVNVKCGVNVPKKEESEL